MDMYIFYLLLVGMIFSQDECCFGFTDECSSIQDQTECSDTEDCEWYCLKTTFSNLPSFKLENPYPNPFNPSTIINYSVSNISEIDISIYDLNGKQVEVLVKSEILPGNYQIKWMPQNNPNGIYIIRMNIKNHTISRKLMYLK